MTIRKMTLDAYPPEFIDLLVKAATEPVHLEMTYREAIPRRQYLYRLRKVMKEEGHPAVPVVDTVIIQIRPDKKIGDGDNPVVLILQSNMNSEFFKQVKKKVATMGNLETDGQVEQIEVKLDNADNLTIPKGR